MGATLSCTPLPPQSNTALVAGQSRTCKQLVLRQTRALGVMLGTHCQLRHCQYSVHLDLLLVCDLNPAHCGTLHTDSVT